MTISPLELESQSDHDREEEGQNNGNGNNNGNGSLSTCSDDSFGSPLHRRRGNRQRIQSIEIEDEEFEEALGLLGHPIANHTDFEEQTAQGRQNSARAWVWWIVTILLVAIVSRVLYHKEKQWVTIHGNQPPPSLYECPMPQETTPQDPQHTVGNMVSQSVEDLASTIPEGDTLSVEYTYEQLRENLRDWTATQIAPYLLPSDAEEEEEDTPGIIRRVSILESSSHTLGLNLFLTLDLLEQMQHSSSNHPTQFWIYGNDQNPFPSSFALFRNDEKLKQLPNVHLGVFCAAEDAPSMDLSYIPEQTFDMVYCGHIPAMTNPLDLTDPPETWFSKYQEICTSEEHDWEGTPWKDLVETNQQIFFETWVADMVRVVRPGGIVVLENLAVSWCESSRNEGGVSRDWWVTLAKQHEDDWDIDPTTVVVGDDFLRDWRYHVVMRKKAIVTETESGGAD